MQLFHRLHWFRSYPVGLHNWNNLSVCLDDAISDLNLALFQSKLSPAKHSSVNASLP